MAENLQNNEEGLSLIEIIRVLLHKIKLLILIVLIGGICGGAFGVWYTHDMKYYGTALEFYVNPEKPVEIGTSSSSTANAVGSQYGVYGAYGRHVMDAIIKLLSSESFAEKLMLEDDGLPSTEIYTSLDPTSKDFVDAKEKMDAAKQAWNIAKACDEPRAEALNALNIEWEMNGYSGSFNRASYEKMLQAEANNPIPQELKDAYEVFDLADQARIAAVKEATEAQKLADEPVEKVLKLWRDDPLYANNLTKFQAAVKYSYLGDDEDVEDANNLARSFIYVNISVLNDEAFADDLLIRVKRSVPEYIEQNMIVPTDYEGTSCTRITRNDDIRPTNPNFTRNQSIKYAILAALAAGVIAAVVIIIIDSQDKRLRDYEFITTKFKVPVLGIIPTIEEMKQAAELKKLQNKGGK